MSIKPILFNTEMVRAIPDGRKTTTRRIVKPQPMIGSTIYPNIDVSGKVCAEIWGNGAVKHIKQPYHRGDILWVRETWKVQSAHRFESNVRIMFKAGGPLSTIQFPGRNSQATSRDDYDAFIDKWMQGDGWHPSIHMPREAARIFLRVTDVRVERLQEIDANGIRAEGLTSACVHAGDMEIAVQEFALLWSSTIKPSDLERYGWAANPWVWVIEFERCEKPEEV